MYRSTGNSGMDNSLAADAARRSMAKPTCENGSSVVDKALRGRIFAAL
jgi:hypothetical protein